MTSSASSRCSPAWRTSRSAIAAYFACRCRLCASRSSGLRWSDRTTRGGRPSAPVRAQSAPGRGGSRNAQLDRLHRLAQDPVGEDDHRRPVALGQLEGVRRERHRLGDRGRREDRDPVVAVAVALDGLEVVGLARPDAAEARTAAHDVDEDDRDLGGGHVAHRLGHQADPRRGRADEDARARRGRAERHVDRPELRLRLDEGAALLGHAAGHPLEELGLGRDRVAEVGVAAGLDRGLGDRLVALHQDAPAVVRRARLGRSPGRRPRRGLACRHAGTSRGAFGRARIVRTQSGQTRAQWASDVQASGFVIWTGW